jgi:hypothetical protein
MFPRRRKQNDFNAEVEAHLQMETEELKEQGLSEEEARMAARRAFGNVTLAQERFYESGRLVIVWEQNPSRGWTTNIVSLANFNDWRSQNTVFSGMAAVDPTSFNLAGSDEPIEIGGELVTANLLSLLGVQPIRGRGFQPEDDRPGSAPVAIASYGLWQRRYGGDPRLIGRPIILDGRSYPVVGIAIRAALTINISRWHVLRPELRCPRRREKWIPSPAASRCSIPKTRDGACR